MDGNMLALDRIGIIFLSVWLYYSYVIELCIFTVYSAAERIYYLTPFHCLFFMLLWSYLKIIRAPIGLVPEHFKLSEEDVIQLEKDESEEFSKELEERCARNLPVSCRTIDGCVRYCDKCRHIKPDRTHHCSVCETCVLKMDHHCYCINTCISFTNYKFFVLFLFYALLLCLLISATSLQYVIQVWHKSKGKSNILLLFFVTLISDVVLMLLLGYHCYLISANRTTLESFIPPTFITGPDKNGFSLGRKANFEEVFGVDKLKWIIPVPSSLGDGINFPHKTLEEVRCTNQEDTDVHQEDTDEAARVVSGETNMESVC